MREKHEKHEKHEQREQREKRERPEPEPETEQRNRGEQQQRKGSVCSPSLPSLPSLSLLLCSFSFHLPLQGISRHGRPKDQEEEAGPELVGYDDVCVSQHNAAPPPCPPGSGARDRLLPPSFPQLPKLNLRVVGAGASGASGATADVLDKREAPGGLWKRGLRAVWRCACSRALLGSTRGLGWAGKPRVTKAAGISCETTTT